MYACNPFPCENDLLIYYKENVSISGFKSTHLFSINVLIATFIFIVPIVDWSLGETK
jgi:hypothetical protein